MSVVDTDGVLEMTALESRAEIANLEALQAERRKLVKKYAPLAARFKGGSGNGSSSDAARKRHRAGIANLILREQFREKGEKDPSETALERMANADKRHVDFCDELELQFADFLMLENEIADINEQIRNREECLRCWRAEIGLAR